MAQHVVVSATTADVAIVGGGPAGSALAIRLARSGIATTLIERRSAPTWHACGVFSSPLTRGHLAELGMSATEIAALNRPIAALDLETTRGVRCRIEYESGPACGFDRLALETTLLERARAAGATVMTGTVVRNVELSTHEGERSRLQLSSVAAHDAGASEQPSTVTARLVVGADGSSSVVARAAGVYRVHRLLDRSGITFHRVDSGAPDDHVPMAGRFVFDDGWYVGIAPVPAGRVNIGIVVRAVRDQRPAETAEHVISSIPGPAGGWMTAPTLDRVAVAGRLEHHAARVAGRTWLLVGDSIGFIDPLTGEGLLRAFQSARLAAHSIEQMLRGSPAALEDYDRHVRRKFHGKNMVSWMMQMFLAQPLVLDYAIRRLARRDALRSDLTLVLTDQQPPSRVVNPAFIARLLAP